MSLISIKHISKSYETHKILDDVSLEVEKGDIYGILGLSGAGKSTLVRCINGLENFDEGEITFHDEILCSPTKKVSKEHKHKIGMIFQGFNLLEQRDVLGNVMLGLEFVKDKNKKEKALEAIKKVGLEDKINFYPSELSGGQQQRVAIARALALEPEVILSDDATSALDPETTQSILDLLKKLNKEYGLTIIMISHQMQVIEQICNKVAIIDKAKIVEEGNLDEVFLKPQTDIAKSLIYSNQVKTKLDENKTIRLIFDGNTDEPILANIIQCCSILVSILYADTKVINNRIYGQMIIKLPKHKADVEKLKKYLEIEKIKYEEVDN